MFLMYPTSAPAQKCLPSPVSTTARTPSSSASPSMARPISPMSLGFRALRAPERANITVATPLPRSISRCS